MKLPKRPIAYVLAATNHGQFIINKNDYHLTPEGGYGVGFDIFNHSEFSSNEVEIALWLLDKRRERFGDGVFAIDCGANIGVHTIEWARHMHGWGSLVAVEAQERVFYALAGNIALNNCFNARAVWAAVGSSAGSIAIPVLNYFQPSSFGSFEILKKQNTEFIGQTVDYEGEVIDTPMFAVDDLSIERVDFIKIDIEGMEVDALNGAINTINRCRPYLLVEKIKSDQLVLFELLAKFGYFIFDMGMNVLAVPSEENVISETADFLKGLKL